MNDDLTTWRELRELEARIGAAGDRGPPQLLIGLFSQAHQLAGMLGDEARRDLYGFGLGVELYRSGQDAAASHRLESAPQASRRLGISPADAYLWRARCRSAMTRDEEAIADYEAAISAGIDAAECVTVLEARRELADALLRAGSPGDRARVADLLTAAVEQLELLGDEQGWRENNAILRRVAQTGTGMARRARDLFRSTPGWDHAIRLSNAVDEVMAGMRDGNLDRARWLVQHMVVGVGNLVAADVLRLRLVLNVADLAAGIAVRRGDLGGAMQAARRALAEWDPAHVRLGLAADAAKVFGRLASLSYLLDDDRSGDAAALQAQALADSTGMPRVELRTRVQIARSRSGQPAVAQLREIAGRAADHHLVDIQMDALLGIAVEAADPDARLAALDAAETLLPVLARSLSGRYHADAVPQLRAFVTLLRATTLAHVDPARARALVAADETDLSALGTSAALVRFTVDVADGHPDARLSAMDAAAAVISQVEASALENRRESAFRRLRDDWAAALETLADIGTAEAAMVAVQLVEVGNRGTLTAFAYRGASAGISLDMTADTDDVAHRLRDAAHLLAAMNTVPAQQPAALAGRPALAFAVTDAVPGVSRRGVRITVDDRGTASIERFQVSGAALRLLEMPSAELYRISPADPAWTELSTQLLGHIAGRLPDATPDQPAILLIAPGDPLLARIPWAACRIGRDEMLIHRFAVQIVPALSLLTGPRTLAGITGRALLYTAETSDGGSGLLDTSAERHAWAVQHRWQVFPHDPGQRLTADEFADALRLRGQWAVAYVAAHGRGSGLAHHLVHADGSVLTVRDALGLWWPELVILSSCHVGAMEPAPGADPLGLPLVCLLRGASFVIGCNESITEKGAASIGAALAEHLAASGESPVQVLRSAQLHWLSRRADGALRTWAPYQVISLC